MAVRNDFTAGEVLAAADLNDTFASKVDYSTPTNAQSGTAYTFVADDAERITTASNGSAVTLTIPPQTSVTWGAATILRVVNYGAGAVTVAGGSGVTVTNTASTIGQYSAGAAIRTGSDAWTVVPFGESPPSATGGNEVVEVGGYKYHLFTSSSTFVVSGNLDAEIVVIGAGGGGGRGNAGGGGGGAKEPSSGYSTQSLSAGSYTVTIASGGAGSTDNAVKGATPSATSFAGSSTISANGGGGGASASNGGGAAGGSGGGGNYAGTSGGTASGSNTNAGGSGVNSSPNYGSGGGGGATATGGNGTSTTGGNGGQGLLLTTIDANLTSGNFTTFTGMTRVCSGGGGGWFAGGSGGTGGTGGGSAGAPATAATSFGSGGGGALSSADPGAHGGNGYGGLVIVRYAI